MANRLEFKMRTYLAGLTTSADDFYSVVAIQGADFPYGVVYKVSPGKDYTHEGSNLAQSTMRCACYAENSYDAKILAGEVITGMEAWPNTEANVQAVFLEGENDLESDNIIGVTLDFIIWHKF